ncbi:protein NYNRIN-like [Tripterygium wilfordii]|uniref:protein NYNRIN-like n=1 Tax=Tripterygium wilfordii TaxID=458696 RepID=UPI0018F849D2|nr:protein NYNRIN-like [Tripterygium wilfordii]
MGEMCAQYAKGCQACKRYGLIQRAPAKEMALIIKPRPFKGWVIDLIGKIYPPSSKHHTFIIVAIDFFTKWVEAIPLEEIAQENVIEFIKNHIIYRFGIPQTIMVDHGTSPNGERVKALLEEFGM